MRHILNIRCKKCQEVFLVRRPNNFLTVAKVLNLVICPFCHPEQSDDVCASCRLPFSVVPRASEIKKKWKTHRKGSKSSRLCNPCRVAIFRYKKKEKGE